MAGGVNPQGLMAHDRSVFRSERRIYTSRVRWVWLMAGEEPIRGAQPPSPTALSAAHQGKQPSALIAWL